MFTHDEITQIEAHGLTVAQVESQIENFRTGFPALPVVRAASGGDGVVQLSEEEVAAAEAKYAAELAKNPKKKRPGGERRDVKCISDHYAIQAFIQLK